jgi:hypothetical protein
MKINDVDMPDFTNGEFPEDPDLYAHPVLLGNMQKTRNIVNCEMYVSTASGALARFDDDSNRSKHYAMNKYSEAIDVFFNCNPYKAFLMLLQSGLWGGIGVYFDTERKGVKHVMFHLDLRNKKLMWFRLGGKYFYQSQDNFYKEMSFWLRYFAGRFENK